MSPRIALQLIKSAPANLGSGYEQTFAGAIRFSLPSTCKWPHIKRTGFNYSMEVGRLMSRKWTADQERVDSAKLPCRGFQGVAGGAPSMDFKDSRRDMT
ncbi:Hypothetical protein NTJ_10501 [Nesidiocoris tenuis]|uniref:Uncharacterized protein n=1 Tax=Nesidiocoris tenuis TaxID=355587 RepID=A0ABN7B4J9_9HEMI|nr:Hypothetical protein NTJ_10501 [Nesidiocoris tenuis]